MPERDIMDENKLINFIEFFLEAELEETGEEEVEFISNELEEAGLKPQESEQQVLEMINEAEREVKKEKGEEFKKAYYELQRRLKENSLQMKIEEPELAVAFRKLEAAGDADDLLDDKEKLKLMDYIKKRKNRK